MAPTEKENASARLLIFGSDASSRQALLERMGAWDFNVVVASSSTKVFHRMHEHVPDGVVCMWPMRATHGGLDLLASLRSFDERMMIVVTGFEGDDPHARGAPSRGRYLLASDLQHGRIGRPPTGGYTATAYSRSVETPSRGPGR